MPLTIPYFELPNLGFVEPWGLLVATGTIVGVLWAVRRARQKGLDVERLKDLAAWGVVGGFVGARLGHVFFYHWWYYQDHLTEIPQLWLGGMSSIGGFTGATIMGLIAIRRYKINVWRYGDVAAFCTIFGWAIGRIGCALIHDHPGQVSDFFLAVEMDVSNFLSQKELMVLYQETQGTIQARHDLGLYDSLLSFAITGLFLFWDRRPRFPGFYLGWFCILYFLPRFFLDYLRATDVGQWSDTRYLQLTPAQYGSIMLVMVGGWILWRQRNKSCEEHTT